MTNAEKFQEIFKKFATEVWAFPEKDFLTWLNAEYKEPTVEHEQKINKSAMMQEIYMEGVNMGGEYQGCWVRFKEIEKIVDKYVR